MNIVILERGTVGMDVSVDILHELGNVTIYENSKVIQVADRVKDADIIIANKMPLSRHTLKDASHVKLIAQFMQDVDTYIHSYGAAFKYDYIHRK